VQDADHQLPVVVDLEDAVAVLRFTSISIVHVLLLTRDLVRTDSDHPRCSAWALLFW
jgi:hypothetical protein